MFERLQIDPCNKNKSLFRRIYPLPRPGPLSFSAVQILDVETFIFIGSRYEAASPGSQLPTFPMPALRHSARAVCLFFDFVSLLPFSIHFALFPSGHGPPRPGAPGSALWCFDLASAVPLVDASRAFLLLRPLGFWIFFRVSRSLRNSWRASWAWGVP